MILARREDQIGLLPKPHRVTDLQIAVRSLIGDIGDDDL